MAFIELNETCEVSRYFEFSIDKASGLSKEQLYGNFEAHIVLTYFATSKVGCRSTHLLNEV